MPPIVYRVSKAGDPAETSVHLGRMKKYIVRTSSLVPDFDVLDDTSILLGTTLPVPDLDGSVNKVRLGRWQVEFIDGKKRGVVAAAVNNFQYHLKLRDFPP